MFATGRLWRRAPVWRFCLVAAIAGTALAAMFPPELPAWTRRAARSAASPPPQASRQARFVPQEDPPPSATGPMQIPPPGPGRSGIIPFAGRQVMLPAGQWQELVMARDGAAVPVQVELLGRIEAGRLTGLLLAGAPNPITAAADGVPGLAACFAPNTLASQAAPEARIGDVLAHECWTLAATDLTSPAARATLDGVLTRGMARLDQFGAIVPDRMLALRYLRTDRTGWLTVLLLLPDRRAADPAALRHVEAWVRRYVPRLHDGFAGQAVGSVARDPG